MKWFGRGRTKEVERAGAYWAPDGLAAFNGQQYGLLGGGSMPSAKHQRIEGVFDQMAQGVHRQESVVSAAVFVRSLLLSQLKFKFRNERNGDVFGTQALAPLERPGLSTRAELLVLAEHHVSYGGNAFFYRDPRNRIRLLRPDWVTQVIESESAPENVSDVGGWLDARVSGYLYAQNGDPNRIVSLLPAGREQGPVGVVHWKPEPDPLNPFIGLSWATSLLAELAVGDQAARHMANYFENGATPNVVHTFPNGVTPDQFKEAVALFQEKYGGASNAYKTMFLMAGADTRVVGNNPNDLALKDIHGWAETRTAMRSRIPAVVLGIREGLAGSALNSGNYGQTRRLLADGYMTPTYQNLCATLEPIVSRPADAELWYSPDDILFLQEDQKDFADIMTSRMAAIRQGIDAGFEPDQVVEAVTTGKLEALMGAHTGLTSVQLTPPDTGGSTDE